MNVIGVARNDVDSSGNSTPIRKPVLPINGSPLPVSANQEKTLTPEVKEKTDGPRKQKETHSSSSSTAPEKKKTDDPSSKQKETLASSATTARGKEKTDGHSSKQKKTHASSSPTAPVKEKTDGRKQKETHASPSTTAAKKQETDVPPSKHKETHVSSSTGKEISSGSSNKSPPSKPAKKKNNYPPISTGTAVPEVENPTPKNTAGVSLIGSTNPVDTDNYEGFTPSIRSSGPLVG